MNVTCDIDIGILSVRPSATQYETHEAYRKFLPPHYSPCCEIRTRSSQWGLKYTSAVKIGLFSVISYLRNGARWRYGYNG